MYPLRRRYLLALLTLALLFSASPAFALQSKKDATLRADYGNRRWKCLVECGQRHLEYGLDLRKTGLTSQSAAQIILAVEVSEKLNPGANTVLRIMRDLDDKFWKKNTPRPTTAKIEAYGKKARDLVLQDQKERLALATWAFARELTTDAHEEFMKLLIERDEPLELDDKGALVLESGSIPKEAAARIREEAVTINEKLYVRDAFLERLPELKQIHEVSSAALRVRSTSSTEEAAALHAIASALLPALEKDIGARPDRRLNLVLFGERKMYEAWLDASRLSGHRVVDGLTDRTAFVSVICTEGHEAAFVRGLALHELTHLYQYGVSRAVMPGWYSEGFADTYGGAGTFAWDGSKLSTGSSIERHRIDALLQPGGLVLLRDLLSIDPLSLWAQDKERALRFYAQSWAFLRYMRTGAGDEIAARFDQWETMCRGAALGATIDAPDGAGGAGVAGVAAAQDLFLEKFVKDLPRLEDGFVAWLKKL